MNIFSAFHQRFEQWFAAFREGYGRNLSWALTNPRVTVSFFLGLMVVSLALFPALGRDFFPQIDAGQMRLHVRTPPGTRLEQTQAYFADVEARYARSWVPTRWK